MDKKVTEYIEKQKSPQKEIINKVRKILLKTLPNPEEKYGWGVLVYAGGKFYLGAMKERVHMGFSIVGLSKKETESFEGSGKTMKHIKINSLKDVDEKKIKELILLINRKAKCVQC